MTYRWGPCRARWRSAPPPRSPPAATSSSTAMAASRRCARGRGAGRRRQNGAVMIPGDVPFEMELADGEVADEPALVVDVEGFEGPLDVLLMLARQQKVDLAKISVLELADQYLIFVEEARRLR